MSRTLMIYFVNVQIVHTFIMRLDTHEHYATAFVVDTDIKCWRLNVAHSLSVWVNSCNVILNNVSSLAYPIRYQFCVIVNSRLMRLFLTIYSPIGSQYIPEWGLIQRSPQYPQAFHTCDLPSYLLSFSPCERANIFSDPVNSLGRSHLPNLNLCLG